MQGCSIISNNATKSERANSPVVDKAADILRKDHLSDVGNYNSTHESYQPPETWQYDAKTCYLSTFNPNSKGGEEHVRFG